MTKDAQIDRTAAPLAPVSNEIHPNQHKPIPDMSAKVLLPAAEEASESAVAHVESFEGFSSFG